MSGGTPTRSVDDMKTPAIAAAAALGTVLATSGCGLIGFGTNHHHDAQTFDAPGDHVTVDTDHDVELTVGAADELAVQQRGRRDIDVDWSAGDSTLTLRAENQWFGAGHAESSVEVPPGVAITVRTSNGDIELTGFADGIKVTNRNGDVSLDDVTGAVHVENQNGNIELATDQPLSDVRSESHNGDVSAEVGTDTTYCVEAESANGDVTVDLRHDADSDRVITASSNNGNVTVEP